MRVVGGSTSQLLAQRLAQKFGTSLEGLMEKRFPDGELYIRLPDLEGEDVVLVQNTYPDEAITELNLLQDAVLEMKPLRLTTVIPYMGYARQDKVFLPGEPISARAIAQAIRGQVILVSPHKPSIKSLFPGDVSIVSGKGAIASWLSQRFPKTEMIIAPDKGAIALARNVARELHCGYASMEKNRVDAEHVEVSASFDVGGKAVAIVDDIISTGGTVIEVARWLRAHGARRVYAGCVHGLFVGNSLPRVNEACDEVGATDTVEGAASVASVAGAIVGAIKERVK